MNSELRGLNCGRIAAVLLLCLASDAFAQKTGRYAGYGAGIGALVGVIAGGDLGSAAVGAAVGAAGGAVAGSVADDKDSKAAAQQQQAAAERQKAEAEAQERGQAEAQAQAAAEQAQTEAQAEAEIVGLMGEDNYESYKALRACQHDRAVALANAGATSSDPEHQLTSLWLQALIATDRRDPETAEQYLPQLVEQDGDIDTVQQASLSVDQLVLDLRQERRDLDMPSCT